MPRSAPCLALALLLAPVLLAACARAPGASAPSTQADPPARPTQVTVAAPSGAASAQAAPAPLAALAGMAVANDPRSPLAARVDVTTSLAVQVEVEYWSAGTAVQRTPRSASGRSHSFTLLGMRADTVYSLRALATLRPGVVETGATATFATGSLPAGIPPLAVVARDPAALQPGVTLFGLRTAPGDPPEKPRFVGVDDEGEVVWLYQDPLTSVGAGDVKRLPDGNLLLLLRDRLRIVTPEGDTVRELALALAPINGYHHDALALPSGNWLVLTDEVRTIQVPLLGGLVPVKGDGIVELGPDGDVLWEWWTFDHLDTSRYPGPLSRSLSNGAYDWTHSNALVHLPAEDALLLSVRHQSWVVKIDRATGNVLWRLGEGGDFTALPFEDPDSWPYSQHSPELQADGGLLLFDNGNERPGVTFNTAWSRALELRLEPGGGVSHAWSFRVPLYNPTFGDADRLANGNVLVCAGSLSGPHANGVAHLYEVTHEDPARVVWELEVAGTPVYRATRLRSLREF